MTKITKDIFVKYNEYEEIIETIKKERKRKNQNYNLITAKMKESYNLRTEFLSTLCLQVKEMIHNIERIKKTANEGNLSIEHFQTEPPELKIPRLPKEVNLLLEVKDDSRTLKKISNFIIINSSNSEFKDELKRYNDLISGYANIIYSSLPEASRQK